MSIPKIPPGKTWFDLHPSFSVIPIDADQHVSTTEFLSATEETVTLFDYFGSAVFTPIKQDMLFNIGRVRDRQAASPATCASLQSLVESERGSGSRNGTEGLTWLIRGLNFMAHAFGAELTENASISPTQERPKSEVSDLFRASYKTTLAPYHNFFIKAVFKAAMSAAPRRRDLYRRLTGDGVDAEITRDGLRRWVASLEAILSIVMPFLAQEEARDREKGVASEVVSKSEPQVQTQAVH